MTSDSLPPTWVDDQARAWRIAAAIWDHDGSQFALVLREANEAGDNAIASLIATLGRNLLARLRMSNGTDDLNDLIGAELVACADEPMREVPDFLNPDAG